ncbi:MAG: flagellar biosynthesis protein FlhB, partial [Pseudomonadota bacterium]
DDDTEKTEDPTQKKLEDAHKKGDVAKSQEVNTWFIVAGIALVAWFAVQPMASGLNMSLRGFIVNAHAIPVDGEGLRDLWMELGLVMASNLALPLAIIMAMALAGNLVQHKLVWSVEPITPKFSKVSPISGFKRLFSPESLVNFAKGLVKLTIVGVLMGLILWPQRDRLDALIATDPMGLLSIAWDFSLQLVAGVFAIMTVVAALDFLYQRQRWFEKQKMSLRDVKDEFKQTEGDPAIKGRIRQLRMERGRKRMMQAVPDATVIVTNPTHYSVALKYEQGMNAPICVAKGIDETALRIRTIAREHTIPLVENPPLARALHATVEIDREIPEEHYRAVAEVIGYVMKLRQRGAWRADS